MARQYSICTDKYYTNKMMQGSYHCIERWEYSDGSIHWQYKGSFSEDEISEERALEILSDTKWLGGWKKF